jgi:hypothetical protein
MVFELVPDLHEAEPNPCLDRAEGHVELFTYLNVREPVEKGEFDRLLLVVR